MRSTYKTVKLVENRHHVHWLLYTVSVLYGMRWIHIERLPVVYVDISSAVYDCCVSPHTPNQIRGCRPALSSIQLCSVWRVSFLLLNISSCKYLGFSRKV